MYYLFCHSDNESLDLSENCRILSNMNREMAGITGVIVTLLIIVTVSDTASANSVSGIGRSFDEIRDSIISVLDRYSIPGAALALVSADSVFHTECIGFAAIESSNRVSEGTLFCVGSCTKSFLGLGFLKLLQEGMIDLQMPVNEIIPEIKINNPWEDHYPVRVVHLLEHTSGFDDIHANALYNEINMEMPLRQALELRSNSRCVRWQPGTRRSYSSPGYTVAGYILEQVTGQRYEDYLRQNLLIPIGMNTSCFRVTEEAKILLATGYDDDGNPLPYIQGFDRPASSLNSSIQEMALFVRFLINRGKVNDRRIISDSLMSLLGKQTSTVASRAGLQSGYSFGVGFRFREGLTWFGHSGGGPGFTARYSILKDHNLGYVVLVNKFAPEGVAATCKIIERLLSEELELKKDHTVSLPRDILESYCGYYALQSSRIQLFRFIDVLFGGTTVSMLDGRLYRKNFMGSKEELLPVSATLFRKESEPHPSSVFTTAEDGQIVFATISSYYEKDSPLQIVLFRFLFFGAFLLMLSSVIYGLVWIPVYFYRRFRRPYKENKGVITRIFPMLAVSSLIMGLFSISSQSLLDVGRMSLGNVVFFVCTLFLALFSICSLIAAVMTFKRPTNMFGRLYGLLVSLACFGMTVYLGYCGIIGLRMWAY
jgi:CubicO group peptidase (beta-lactamase class C family)